MCNCCSEVNIGYRVVQTISERNTLPCEERMNGMIVTVVGDNFSYKQYMLKGGDPCVNSNWEPYNLHIEEISETIGHATVADEVLTPLTSEELNFRYPKAKEGFRVTFTELNTTFMKIFNDKWVMSNNIEI